jgi:hypothetical protein
MSENTPSTFEVYLPDLPVQDWRVESHQLAAGGRHEVKFAPVADTQDARLALYRQVTGSLRALEHEFRATSPAAARYREALAAERNLEKELPLARKRADELTRAGGDTEKAIEEATRATVAVKILEVRKTRLAEETARAERDVRDALAAYLAGPYDQVREAAAEKCRALVQELARAGQLADEIKLLGSIVTTCNDTQHRRAILDEAAPTIKATMARGREDAAAAAEAQAAALREEANFGRPPAPTPIRPSRYVSTPSRDTPHLGPRPLARPPR